MKQSSKKVLVLTGAILTIIGLSKNPVYAGISSTHTHQTGEIVEETTVIEATPDIVEEVSDTDPVEDPVTETPDSTPTDVVTEEPTIVVSVSETPVTVDPVMPVAETPITEEPIADNTETLGLEDIASVEIMEDAALVETSETTTVAETAEDEPVVLAAATDSVASTPVRRSLIYGPALAMETATESNIEENNSVPGLFYLAILALAGLLILILAHRNQVITVDSEGNVTLKKYFLFLADACEYLNDLDYRNSDGVKSYLRTILQEEGKYLYAENMFKSPIEEDSYEASESQKAIIEDVIGYEYSDTTTVAIAA